MPSYQHSDQTAWQSILVHLRNKEDRAEFGKLIDQKLTDNTHYLWYPKAAICHVKHKRYVTPEPVNPRYPVYIISKGRWETRLTSKSLEEIKVPYHIVVEPQEYDNYAAVIDPKKILILPFSNLGQGSIPARNWVWEHSIAQGAERHWILDDNIRGFWRFHENAKILVDTGATFRLAEDFTERYTNVAISGMNYYMFACNKAGNRQPPFTLNTRIYSCILIKNDIPYRWRGRYNEDTDLSIRALKDGWCTILFNAFLAWKMTTMEMKGGNTEALYKIKEGEKDGRLLMAESLRDQHPDIVKITQKWGRWQHHVNYGVFKKNKLQLRPDFDPSKCETYGLELQTVDEEPTWSTEVPA